MSITFERTALYEEVWTQPLSQLCMKYGLSDNGLRKICKALTIPLPTAGHWAKVAAGHNVLRSPLPDKAERTSFVSHPPRKRTSFRTSEDDAWLEHQIAFEENPVNRVAYTSTPKQWHIAVAQLRDGLRAAAKEMVKAKRDAEREQKNPNLRTDPGFLGWQWRSFVDRGQVLIDTHRSTPMRVSLTTYERALTILNSLALASKQRGFEVSVDEKEGRLSFKGSDVAIFARITERLEQKWRTERSTWDNKPRQESYKVPTGVLRLFVGARFSEAEIGDRETISLESQLNDVFVKIYRQVIREKERRREQEARKRKWEAEEARREEAAARRREEEAQREKERQRRRALVSEAKFWRVAKEIREYVSHVTSSADKGEGLAVWTTWASRVADGLDPTQARRLALDREEGAELVVRTDLGLGESG